MGLTIRGFVKESLREFYSRLKTKLSGVAFSGNYSDLNGKPTLDLTPTENSNNPVSSGGVYNTIAQSEYVISTSLNDLNTRVSDIEGDLDNIPAAVTESTVSGWGFTKNAGTLTGVSFNGNAATVTNGVASITATIPSTLDQIADGSTRKLSDYIPLSGGSMNGGASLTAVHSDNNDRFAQLHSDGLTVAYDGSSTLYYMGGVQNGSATLNLPTTSGTIALTSQIPTAVTESTVSGWGFTKNAGTLTGVKVNGSNATVTSGVADIGTVITSHAKHKLTATNGTASSTSGTITFVESLTGTTTATDGDLTVTATRKTVTIPAAQVQSDWNATTGMGVILNKPTIPTVNNSTITVQMNGSTVDTFTVNQGSNKTINLGTVITSHQDISGKANVSDLGSLSDLTTAELDTIFGTS